MKKIISSDPWQTGYTYELTAPTGKQFDPEFKPDLTPKEMLELGIFGGIYFGDVNGYLDSGKNTHKDKHASIYNEFPIDWFTHAKIAPTGTKKWIAQLNFFGVIASQPLSVWQKKGWIYKDDPRGWFQWYCRYYMGRRIPDEDMRQIKRWKAISRHIAQVSYNCEPGDLFCRKKQRQAILHWAYDSRRL
jgi:hypothetical protein